MAKKNKKQELSWKQLKNFKEYLGDIKAEQFYKAQQGEKVYEAWAVNSTVRPGIYFLHLLGWNEKKPEECWRIEAIQCSSTSEGAKLRSYLGNSIDASDLDEHFKKELKAMFCPNHCRKNRNKKTTKKNNLVDYLIDLELPKKKEGALG